MSLLKCSLRLQRLNALNLNHLITRQQSLRSENHFSSQLLRQLNITIMKKRRRRQLHVQFNSPDQNMQFRLRSPSSDRSKTNSLITLNFLSGLSKDKQRSLQTNNFSSNLTTGSLFSSRLRRSHPHSQLTAEANSSNCSRPNHELTRISQE